MRRLYRYCLPALVPGVVLLLGLAAGCTGGGRDTGEDDVGPGKGTGSPPKAQTKEISGSGATLKGKVTLDGPEPDLAALDTSVIDAMEKHPTDSAVCKKGTREEINQQRWRIKDGAVQNVYVWLRPPEGSYFKLDDAQKKPPTPEVVLDQPHCAFIPHSLWHFPAYSDGKGGLTKTGQKLIAKNDAPVAHNTNMAGGLKNPQQNFILPPGQQKEVENLKPDPNTPVKISCNIHPWMNATLWVFDHPFVAVTNEKGEYEIKNAPAGADLQVVAWHDAAGFFAEGGNKGDKVKLNAGDNTKDFKVKAK